MAEHKIQLSLRKITKHALHGEKLSKNDNATAEYEAECKKFPYRNIIGQLMYGMLDTLVTIL